MEPDSFHSRYKTATVDRCQVKGEEGKKIVEEGGGWKYSDLKVYLCVFLGRNGDQ